MKKRIAIIVATGKIMDIRTFLQENIVVLDGGTGTLLQEAGLPLGVLPERWNVERPEVVQAVHRAYFDAGSNVVCTNTFGANALKFSDTELDEIIRFAVENAKIARETSAGKQPKFIALDIGPSGKLLKPYGELDFEDAVSLFAKTVKIGVKYGVDCVLIETLGDSYEAKAVLLAVKENCELPVFVSCAYGEDGKLMTGANPSAMVAMIEGLGADAIGVNCSTGAKQMQGVVEELLAKSSLPVLVKPNAGLPVCKDGKTQYDTDEKEFAEYIRLFVEKGARMVGGCCGTTPAFIQATVEKIKGISPKPVEDKQITCVSSYTHAVEFSKPLLIGERINPTGKKRFKQALKDGDVGYILNEGITQKDKGAHILDVNVGMPEIDETKALPKYIKELQAVLDLPLQIDTSNPVAMEKAMRVYNGKPLVNSVNGKEESMQTVFPLVRKYGGVVVALTLDEKGIPDTAEGRIAIAEKIISRAKEYGISKKDILIDPLTLTVGTDSGAGETTLRALREIKTRLGVHTSLGVSNISFGLPNREILNAVFFAQALENGLSTAIINPNSAEILKTYYAFLTLKGLDKSAEEYIRFATEILPTLTPTAQATQTATISLQGGSALKNAIVQGLKTEAETACEALLKEKSALQIVEEEIVPALDEVGKAYEEKKVYLPKLLMSAESAKSAFEKIKLRFLQTGETQTKKCKIVLATVKGDIHDIGKNIVATLMENYGFDVIDLGRDTPPERILDEVLKTGAPIVGLSALMTTTVPSMAETITLLREHAPQTKILVGGAVLTKEYAQTIGADAYAKDGMEGVRYAESVYKELCKK